MLDIQTLRKNLDAVVARLASRGFAFPQETFTHLEQQRRHTQMHSENLQAERKKLSKEFGQKKATQQDTSELAQAIDVVNTQLDIASAELTQIQHQLQTLLLHVPNMPDESVPLGSDESHNVVVHTHGTIPILEQALDHTHIGHTLGMDFEQAAHMAGARFVVLKGKMATLHRALAQFMLAQHIQAGYEEVYVPLMLNGQALQNTGQLPKFEEDLFKVPRAMGEGLENFYLIPTAEVPITNLMADKILPTDFLERKFVAHTPCFRSEAGSHGRDTKGMIRQHQFDKVELVHISLPEHSMQALEHMSQQAERILQLLELPFRRILLCTGDMGFGSCKTYDLEVWIPSQNTYREISSCSNMGDFQARRMQTRYKNRDGNMEYIHTLNGSALAVGRTLVAILENYQQADGSVRIPLALQPYCGFDVLKAD